MCKKCHKRFKSCNGWRYHTEKIKCDPVYDQGYASLPEDITDEHIHMSLNAAGSEEVPMETADYVEVMSMDTSDRDRDCVGCQEDHDWLRELAIIATGPQSPLMQVPCSPNKDITSNSKLTTFALERSLHSYAKPARSRSPSPINVTRAMDIAISSLSSKQLGKPMRSVSVDEDMRVSSSSPFPWSPSKSADSNETWSHSWPTAVWQCFIRGTKILFLHSINKNWQLAEDLAREEFLMSKAAQKPSKFSFAPKGLRILEIKEGKSVDTFQKLHLQFSADIPGQSHLAVECSRDHPFFVKDKGWSSFDLRLTAKHYGIPCTKLQIDDLCLPPSHPEATFAVDVFASFESYHFTPEDSSAVFTLSSMAKQRRDQELSPQTSPQLSPTHQSKKKAAKSDVGRTKRPMNAFMLFAKKYRMELMHQYPGKDNRTISVLLGDKWKKLASEERQTFAQEARVLADLHRKVNPDCWKRKRSYSTGSIER